VDVCETLLLEELVRRVRQLAADPGDAAERVGPGAEVHDAAQELERQPALQVKSPWWILRCSVFNSTMVRKPILSQNMLLLISQLPILLQQILILEPFFTITPYIFIYYLD
jgi:hypothetical protein